MINKIGPLRVRHSVERPFVYLDQAPWMAIAQNFPKKFEKALARRDGTLAVSWFNLMERSRMSDQHAAIMDSLLRRNWPKVAFLESFPEIVIPKENRWLVGGPREMPQLDPTLIKHLWSTEPPNATRLRPEGMLRLYREPEVRTEIEKRWKTVTETWAREIGLASKKYRSDPAAKKKVDRGPRGPRLPAPTRYVFEAAAGYLIKKGIVKANDVADFFHMVIPISYADYVALDGNWKEAARQVQKSVRDAGLLTHEAKVYAVTEVDKLIADLAASR